LLALSLSLFAASCIDDDDDGTLVVVPPADTGTGSGSSEPPPATLEWRAAIISNDVLQWSVTGSATVLQVAGNTAFTASISLRNDLTGTARPWHVHFGTCATGGGIVGDDAAYPRLSIGTDGAAAATATIRNASLDPAALYHVNVHESNAQFTTLIACGDLILQ
jgi:hypothetical protein